MSTPNFVQQLCQLPHPSSHSLTDKITLDNGTRTVSPSVVIPAHIWANVLDFLNDAQIGIESEALWDDIEYRVEFAESLFWLLEDIQQFHPSAQ